MSKIENAVQWAIGIANDNSHGYSQNTRWGTPDYDCSSLVISAFEQAGIPVKTAGATYTGNMLGAFQSCGFEIVTDGSRKRGDVLLNVIHHTALYIGNNQMVEARISEIGTTWGVPGDQTGREICISEYRDYPWDYVLRYMPDPVAEPEDFVDMALEAETIPVGAPDESEAATGLPLLSRADGGRVVMAVKSMQLLLIYRWYISCGPDGPDGDFGPATENALREFQRAHGLEDDGICGHDTWVALIN